MGVSDSGRKLQVHHSFRDRDLSADMKYVQHAYATGLVKKLYNEPLLSELYEVYQFYIPVSVNKHLRFLKNYFEYLHLNASDRTRRRHNHFCSFAEVALVILSRVKNLTDKGNAFLAGSRHVCPVAWAAFGREEEGRHWVARNYFENIEAVAHHYAPQIQGECMPVYFHFRHPPLAVNIAKKFDYRPMNSANFWMAVALTMAYEIVHECGPDCPEFFELFSNNLDETPDTIDFANWRKQRADFLGIKKVNLDYLKYPSFIPKAPTPPERPEKWKAEITQISDSQDLALGEVLKPFNQPKPVLMLPAYVSHSTCADFTSIYSDPPMTRGEAGWFPGGGIRKEVGFKHDKKIGFYYEGQI